MEKDVHVVREEGDKKWAVKVNGKERPHATYRTQKEAIQAGRDLSRRNRSELVVHGRDGQIRDKHSYGNDPRSIKG